MQFGIPAATEVATAFNEFRIGASLLHPSPKAALSKIHRWHDMVVNKIPPLGDWLARKMAPAVA